MPHKDRRDERLQLAGKDVQEFLDGIDDEEDRRQAEVMCTAMSTGDVNERLFSGFLPAASNELWEIIDDCEKYTDSRYDEHKARMCEARLAIMHADMLEEWYDRKNMRWENDSFALVAWHAYMLGMLKTLVSSFYEKTKSWPTVQEAAKKLGVEPGTVSDYIKDGVLNSNGLSGKGKRRVDPASIDAHLARQLPQLRQRNEQLEEELEAAQSFRQVVIKHQTQYKQRLDLAQIGAGGRYTPRG